MLAYFLAIAVAIISVIIYLTAFFSPKIHRKDDFLWSGLGLFYALILWFCAGRITGALLLGQLAAVSIIVAFIWETRKLREAIVASATEFKLEGFSILDLILTLLAKIPGFSRQQPSVTQPEPPETQEIPTEEKPETTPAQEQPEITEEIAAKEIATTLAISPPTTTSVEEKEQLTEAKVTPPTEEVTTTEESGITEEETEVKEEDTKDQILTSLTPETVEEKTRDSSSTTETETEITPTPTITESGEKTEKKGLFRNLLGSLGGLTQVFGKKASPPPATTSPKSEAELDLTLEEESTSTTKTEVDTSSNEEFEKIFDATAQTKKQPAEEVNLELDTEGPSESQATTSPESKDDLTLEQVPEEDKISSLTELTEKEDITTIEKELDDFLQESEKKSKSDSSGS